MLTRMHSLAVLCLISSACSPHTLWVLNGKHGSEYNNHTDEYIAHHDVQGMKAVCAGNFTTESKADVERACKTLAQWNADASATFAQLPCNAFDPLPGEVSRSQGPQQRLHVADVPEVAVATKLQACGLYEDLLVGRFVSRKAGAFVFTQDAGAAFLRASLLNHDLQQDAVEMILDHLDPKDAEHPEYADLLANATPELSHHRRVFNYLVEYKHAKVTEWLPQYLDSEGAADRIAGCRAVKHLGARVMLPRVERLATNDAFIEMDRGAAVWPVRQACMAALGRMKK